jgi:hypothetical protein
MRVHWNAFLSLRNYFYYSGYNLYRFSFLYEVRHIASAAVTTILFVFCRW